MNALIGAHPPTKEVPEPMNVTLGICINSASATLIVEGPLDNPNFWVKSYRSQGDMAWELEHLQILPPADREALRSYLPTSDIVVAFGCLPSPKETMRTFTLHRKLAAQ
jgi:hypothetical protein